jgi:hypothetical protein
MRDDTAHVLEWAHRVAWRSTSIVVVAGTLQCKFWELLRRYNHDLVIILFDHKRDDFSDVAQHNVLCTNNIHEMQAMVGASYRVPTRVEVIGTEDVRRELGAQVSACVDTAVRGVYEAEHTTRVNAERWTRLGLVALEKMTGEAALNGMPECLAEKTAVIVGAGPSLNKNIKVLAKHQDKVAIFATDAVVAPLHRAGIKPHVIVTVEANKTPTKRTLQNPAWKTAIVVPGVHVAEQVWTLQPKRWLWGVQLVGPIGPFVVEKLGLSLLRSGGSVSTIAFSAAQVMGCKRIVLVGMDSAYANDGTFYCDKVAHKHVQRNAEPVVPVEAYGGIGYVQAPRTLCSYREWFEARSHEASAAGYPVFNATEGGARINGAREVTLEEAIGGLEPCPSMLDDMCAAVDGAKHIEPQPIITGLEEELDKARVASTFAKDGADSLVRAHDRINMMLELPKANILFRSAIGPIQEAGHMPRGHELLIGAKILARVHEKQEPLSEMICGTLNKLKEKHG